MRSSWTRAAFVVALSVVPALVVVSCGNGPVTLALAPDGGAPPGDASSGTDGRSSHDATAGGEGGEDGPVSSGDAADGSSEPPADASADAPSSDAPIDAGADDAPPGDATPADAANDGAPADGGVDARATDAAGDATDAAGGDGGSCTPLTQPCDVVCQNCGANLKCDPISASFNDGGEGAFCANAGTVAADHQCGTANVDDCAAGSLCLEERASPLLDVCVEMCRKDADCKNGGLCAYGPLGGTTVKLCTPKVTGCDPVADTGCAAGTGCYLLTSNEPTGCHITGTLGQDQPCNGEYDCLGGFTCVGFGTPDGGTAYRCAQYCHIAANDCPGADAGTHSCFTLIGFTGPYGVCGP